MEGEYQVIARCVIITLTNNTAILESQPKGRYRFVELCFQAEIPVRQLGSSLSVLRSLVKFD